MTWDEDKDVAVGPVEGEAADAARVAWAAPRLPALGAIVSAPVAAIRCRTRWAIPVME